jgi:hypothetical protein
MATHYVCRLFESDHLDWNVPSVSAVEGASEQDSDSIEGRNIVSLAEGLLLLQNCEPS